MSNELVPIKEELQPIVAVEVPKKSEEIISYQGVSSQPVTQEQSLILLAPIPNEDLDILPTGEVYASQVRYRRILNHAFGPGGWAMVPRGPFTQRESIVYREYALFAGGRFIAEAIGEQEYFEDNTRMSWATAAEACKSNALTRCCKDLGIASECWDRNFTTQFKRDHCVSVFVTQKNGETKVQWRRKDAEPFYKETGFVKPKSIQATIPKLGGIRGDFVSTGDQSPEVQPEIVGEVVSNGGDGSPDAAPSQLAAAKRRGRPPKVEAHPDLQEPAAQGVRPDGETQAAFNELSDAFLRFKASGDVSLTDEAWWSSVTLYEKVGKDGKPYRFEQKSLGDAEAFMNQTYKKFGNAKNVFVWLRKAKESYPHLFEKSLEQQAEEVF